MQLVGSVHWLLVCPRTSMAFGCLLGGAGRRTRAIMLNGDKSLPTCDMFEMMLPNRQEMAGHIVLPSQRESESIIRPAHFRSVGKASLSQECNSSSDLF